MKTLDLFCGCGGMSLGFEKAGFNIVAAYDLWDTAVETYNANFKHKALCKDINTLSVEEIKELNPDIIIGGPPCQDFSSAGKRDESLGRAELTDVFAKKICDFKPNWFVMENVDRIVKSNKLTKIKQAFTKARYGLTEFILDASLCGVPQKRKRYFLVGGMNEKNDFLSACIFSCISSYPMSIRDYMGEDLDMEHYYRHPRSYNRRGVFSIDEPSPTIRGVNRPIPKNYKFHEGDTCKNIDEIRPLTFNERAQIQTFPKNFIFLGNKTDREQMIGNAVPVKLAQYVGEVLLKYIKETAKIT
ncbi:DNA cytosine methyltransferase [Campylobacter sp. MOP7]|uniref:DNA cytosine methyltransferase n=1 Tax=Campylobacter canis TaxID=3378588 RepID=UPI00387EAD01